MKKFIRRMFIYMLVVLMAVSSVPMAVFADETVDEALEAEKEIPKAYSKDSTGYESRLVVKSTERVKIGKTANLSVTLKNLSGQDWSKTELWIADETDYITYYEPDDTEDAEEELVNVKKNVYPFEYKDSLNEHHSIGAIRSGSQKTYNFKVSAKRDLTPGYYPVLIRGKAYTKDDPDNYYLIAKTLLIWAEQPSADDKEEEEEIGIEPVAFIMGENQSTPQGTYGEVMNFGVNLRNTGYKKAYDVRVHMELSENVDVFPFEINDGNYERWMQDMEPGASVSVPYSMAVRPKANSGYYPIKYKIHYREEADGAFMTPIEKTMYVRIIGQDEEELSADAGENERTKARIIVESFETEPETILAGEEFVVKIRMKNASSQIAASNILFTLDPETVNESPVFMTVDGSNSIVVNNLAPGASEVLTMHYSSSPSAEQRSYSITITEQYDSPEYKNAKETVKIALPIKQEARLNTGNIEVMPQSIEMGSETNIMFDINNTGKVTLYNVTAVFEADSIQRSENYVGNIKPGETGSVDTMIAGIAPTMDDGMIRLLINYEDENGTVSTVEKELQLFVTEPMPMEDPFMGDYGMMEEEPMPEPTLMDKIKPYSIPIAVVVGALVGGVIFFVRKRRKKAEMDDEIL